MIFPLFHPNSRPVLVLLYESTKSFPLLSQILRSIFKKFLFSFLFMKIKMFTTNLCELMQISSAIEKTKNMTFVINDSHSSCLKKLFWEKVDKFLWIFCFRMFDGWNFERQI